ncbi:Hypothetical predicted protein, partial [Pelobates cultripes]
VECFGEDNEYHIQCLVLFPTFFLKLSKNKYHAGSASSGSEATFTMEKVFLQR